MPESTLQSKYWLLKAEPDSRIVKGKDVKFSVDDFERVKTSPWEGVRNYEARNLMKEMKVGQDALFYHSNCKNPGIAAFAQVAEEAYPDYTAWDSSHPYYDPKSDSKNPRWFMIDLTFSSRTKHFVSLALLRILANSSLTDLPEELVYIGVEGLKAIKGMDLVTRGRLSVQRVEEDAWKAIVLLAENGGWQELDLKPKPKKGTKSEVKKRGNDDEGEGECERIAHLKSKPESARKLQKELEEYEMSSENGQDAHGADGKLISQRGKGIKRKRMVMDDDKDPPRRSTRARK